MVYLLHAYCGMLAADSTCSFLPVGHCHPKVVGAGVEQMSKLVHLPDSKVTQSYTQHLLSTFPDNMGHVFYVYSG